MAKYKKEMIWEPTDIDPSNSRKDRNYDKIYAVLYNNKITDVYEEQYLKKQTGLGYDVFIKYEKFDSDTSIDFDNIKISYKTSLMDDYKFMVGYPIHEERYHSFWNNHFRCEQVRANAGHILDKFFSYYLPIKSSVNYIFPGGKDDDPLDDIGINFEDNPEFLNGGFYYHSVSVNDFILGFHQHDLYNKCIERYDGELINGLSNKKIKNMVSEWVNHFEGFISKENKLDTWFDGITDFHNNFIDKQIDNIWFIWNDIRLMKKVTTVWNYHYDRWEYNIQLIIKDSIGKQNILNLPFQNNNGKIIDKWNNFDFGKKNALVSTFENIPDEVFKLAVEQRYIYTSYASESYKKFIQNIDKKIPEKYIELMTSILESNDDIKYEKINLCADIISLLTDSRLYIYSDDIFPLVEYFINYLKNNNLDIYQIKNLSKIIQPFEYIRNMETAKTTTTTFDRLVAENFQFNKSIELAIQMLYATKCSHEKHPNNILTKELLRCCSEFTGSITSSSTYYKKTLEYVKYDMIYIYYRHIMMTDLVSKVASVDTNIFPHDLFDIIKLYAVYEYEKIVTLSMDNGSCGRSSVKFLSKHALNVMNTVNFMINKIAKDPDNKVIFEKTIRLVNKVIGGHNTVTTFYSEIVKMIAFFLLCADRYDEEVIDRYISMNDKIGNIPYPSICGVKFYNTIKNILITTMMPLMWTDKLTIPVFDEIDVIIQPLIDNNDDKTIYIQTRSNLQTYLEGI